MALENSPLLSPAQRRLAGLAVGCVAALAIVAALLLLLAGLQRFVAFFSGVIWPLAAAGILALVLRPVVTVFERRLRLRRTAAVVLLYGLFLLALAAAVFAVVPAVVGQVVDLFAYLPSLWEQSVAWAQKHFPEWIEVSRRYLENPTVKSALDGVAGQLRDLVGQVAPTLMSAGVGLFHVLGFAASVAVIPVYLFFFLLTDDDPTDHLGQNLPFLAPAARQDAVFLAREFLSILVAFFRGQLLIGLIMGVLLATGFSVAGLRFGLALGLLIGLLNIIPYLGSILGLAVVLPLAFFQPDGGWTLLGACAAVFAGVQVIEGWLLTPRIMGRQTGLHPVVIIIAVFFWGQALGGLLGMVLGVPLTAFFVTAWRLARHKYFNAAPAAA